MHAAFVWGSALLISVISGVVVQLVAPLTLMGWIIFVGMSAVVIASALYPSLRIKRASIHFQHALRRWVRGNGPSRQRAQPMQFRRTMMGAMACGAALIIYQSMWVPMVSTPAATTHFASRPEPTLGSWYSSMASLRAAVAGPDDKQDGVPKEAMRGSPEASRPSDRPDWAWLVDLLFVPAEPAA